MPTGTIQIFRGADQIASGIPALQWAAPTSTTGVTLSPTQGRLTQTYAATQINIIYDCVLANTDLTITAHVTNNSAASVGGLVLVTVPFQFSATPTGTMPSWHDSYLAQQGLGAFHPGFLVPIGCVYAGDSTYSVAAWSPSELNRASLIQASFISSNALPNPMPVELHTNTTLNAGASTDFSIVLRITTDTTPAGLLSGYKALLRAMSYTPVAKPAMAFQAIAAQWVTPTDPYGYDTNIRRIDLPQGVNLYLQTETPTLKSAGSAGIIFWAPGGYQSTTMYPVDYDVNFNRIAATWPALLQGLQANGFRAGICARFRGTHSMPTEVPAALIRTIPMM